MFWGRGGGAGMRGALVSEFFTINPSLKNIDILAEGGGGRS